MTGDLDTWTAPDEPSTEDFEAAGEEVPALGPRAVLARIVRTVGVLFLVVALLLYFVAPFRSAFIGVLHQLRLPIPKLQSIPLAPEPRSNPKLPT